ncbi:hypothetical protein ONA70_33815 [Micromonospora yasonensis]|nr:hypothetical protein [Micromonospora yasonensis]MCW3845056.1 hypothetical protein [Micromonospora yasonensis]
MVIRAVHLALYAHATKGRPLERRKLYQFVPEIAITTLLLLVAALQPTE